MMMMMMMMLVNSHINRAERNVLSGKLRPKKSESLSPSVQGPKSYS